MDHILELQTQIPWMGFVFFEKCNEHTKHGHNDDNDVALSLSDADPSLLLYSRKMAYHRPVCDQNSRCNL